MDEALNVAMFTPKGNMMQTLLPQKIDLWRGSSVKYAHYRASKIRFCPPGEIQ
jgi:hypothetical protein